MGMSTHVVFLRDKNSEEHKKMLRVLRACNAAGVTLPKEVNNYFLEKAKAHHNSYTTEEPDEPLEISGKFIKYSGDNEDGVEVYVRDIPEGVTVIRFYNSW